VNPPLPEAAQPNQLAGVGWRNGVAALLLLFGLTQMVGDLVGSKALRGIGAVSVAAPFPKVFCDLKGVEGFACEFTLLARTPSGGTNEIALTPELYQRLSGPYNRRNVYGAALAGAPILPRQIWEAVYCYGFGTNGPLRLELGLPPDSSVQVRIRTKTRGRDNVWVLEAPCAQ
jgi:hypothetical protein